MKDLSVVSHSLQVLEIGLNFDSLFGALGPIWNSFGGYRGLTCIQWPIESTMLDLWMEFSYQKLKAMIYQQQVLSTSIVVFFDISDS